MNVALNVIISLITAIYPSTFNKSTAALESTYIMNTNDNVILEVPFVHQVNDLQENEKKIIMSSACGPASITMTLKYLGGDYNISQVINALPNNIYIKGKMFYNLTLAPSIFNKKAVVLKNNYQSIYTALKDGHPIILNIQNYNGLIGHAVVVVGIKNFDGTKAESLIIHDPYVGPYREFKYLTEKTLKQPEGFTNYIGTLSHFYVVNSEETSQLAQVLK